MEGEWSCYRGGHFNFRENGHVSEVVNIMEGQLNGGTGHVTEVASLMAGE